MRPRFYYGQTTGGGGDPLRAQGYKTQNAANPEDLWQPLYDTVNFPAAGTTNQLLFFATPRGQAVNLIVAGAAPAATVKSYRDCNIDNAGVVPTKLFKIVGISLAFRHQVEGAANNPIDRDRLRMGGYLKFRIVDKDILYLPLVAIPEINPYVVATTTASLGTAGGGGANVSMYVFPIPITINPYENFVVEMNFTGIVALNSGLDIIMILQAYMRRPT